MKIAIIGAGPRGLSLSERLIAHSKQNKQAIDLLLFDPFLPGAVWRTDQSADLLLNSVTSQVTLFTDDTLSTGGPVVKGPTLYEWAVTEGKHFAATHAPELVTECTALDSLDPNGHCSRALYGLYQQWFYQQLLKELPESITVNHLSDSVSSLTPLSKNRYQLTTAHQTFLVDAVVLATGHSQAQLSAAEQRLATAAENNGWFYAPPANAADTDLTAVKAGEPVILRGLGLAFYDYVTRLTSGRGGTFVKVNGSLVYQPSGEEPQIIAGSRRGVPYHPRGRNQKTPTQQRKPVFLTPERLAAWQAAKTVAGKTLLFYLKKEAELVYYQTLLLEKQLLDKDQLAAFTAAFVATEGSEDLLKKWQLPTTEWWSWQQLADPFAQKKQQSLQDFFIALLRTQIQDAEKGNLTGPISSALEVFKDLRDPIRFVLDHQLMPAQDLKTLFWQSFVPLNSFLSIGPPVQRLQELVALMEAGVVTLLGPDMTVEIEEAYCTYSKRFDDTRYHATQLIEARIPSTAIRRTNNSLLRQLLNDRIIHPHQLTIPNEVPFETGAIAIDPETNQILGPDDRPYPTLYCFGIPTEGIHWLTAATAQPGTDAWNLRQADQIAADLLHHTF